LLWYAMLLVVSLLGAPSFAIGHRLGVAGQEQDPRAPADEPEEPKR